jgi:hypothetical protein
VKKIILTLVSLVLIGYGAFGGGILDLLDNPTPKPVPTPIPEPEIAILNIDRPSQEVLDKVKGFSEIVKDPTDRAKIAIFNHEFANSLTSYDTDLQQLNDVYVLAAKKFFNNSIVGKYPQLPEMITKLIQEIAGEDNHTLSTEEKQKLSQHFLGVAWTLIQKA